MKAARWWAPALGLALALLIIVPFLVFGAELESFSRGLVETRRARPYRVASRRARR